MQFIVISYDGDEGFENEWKCTGNDKDAMRYDEDEGPTDDTTKVT